MNQYWLVWLYLYLLYFDSDKKLKVFTAKVELIIPTIKVGEYETDGKTFLKFAGTNGFVHLLEIQLEGKRKMNIEDFLRGYRFN